MYMHPRRILLVCRCCIKPGVEPHTWYSFKIPPPIVFGTVSEIKDMDNVDFYKSVKF
jgi:hypothetical protein